MCCHRATTTPRPTPINMQTNVSIIKTQIRMKEIIQIKKHLKCLNADAAQVWAGDFNALTLEDYSGNNTISLCLV